MTIGFDDTPRTADTLRVWDDAREQLGLIEGGAVNIGDLATTQHTRNGDGDQVAVRWFGRGDTKAEYPVDITYEMLDHRTSRFAGALRLRGFEPGAGVATLAGRIPELYVAALGTLKARCVYTPLFSAFGPEPVAQRLEIGAIRVLVTTPVLFRLTVAKILDRLPDLELVLIVGATEDSFRDVFPSGPGSPTVMSFGIFIGEGHDDFDTVETDGENPALLHFTSGTTGAPKGVVHVHEAVVGHAATAQAVLDLGPDDVFWCPADLGWATGTSYGMIAPLVRGATMIVDEAEFDARRSYRILTSQRVNVFYTSPTAIRMLQRIGADGAPESFPDLRLVASVGEPLDAESVLWANRVFGVPILDTWWQTETGAIMIANRSGDIVRPGSMGRPVPGIDATLLERTAEGQLVVDEDGAVREVVDPAETGEIALRTGWPSMFRDYLGRDEKYRSCFVGRHGEWYRSGDLARRDSDGYFWFVGRGDDVITTAGHLVGPCEVEAVLDEHPAVAETGVIGKPDPTAREIDFVDALPHTRSGKIMRRVLRARELGEDEGDTSALDVAPTRSRVRS